MTETQYLLAWTVYLAGAIGCLLSLWFIVGKWHPRLKRPVMMTFAVLFFMPGFVQPDQDFLAPAFLISLYDGLSQGVDAMWRSGQAVAITAGIATIVGLLLPVQKAQGRTGDNKKKSQKGAGHRRARQQRKEPAY